MMAAIEPVLPPGRCDEATIRHLRIELEKMQLAARGLRVGDARKIDGKWWICTDPDMGRFVSFDEQDVPQESDPCLCALQTRCAWIAAEQVDLARRSAVSAIEQRARKLLSRMEKAKRNERGHWCDARAAVDSACEILPHIIAALTPPKECVLVPVKMTTEIEDVLNEALDYGYPAESAWDLAIHAARPEVPHD